MRARDVRATYALHLQRIQLLAALCTPLWRICGHHGRHASWSKSPATPDVHGAAVGAATALDKDSEEEEEGARTTTGAGLPAAAAGPPLGESEEIDLSAEGQMSGWRRDETVEAMDEQVEVPADE